jgi:hypothetical protein
MVFYFNFYIQYLKSCIFKEIKCSLKCVYNYFTQSKRKTPINFWKGRYQCELFPDCQRNYLCKIKVEPNGKEIVELEVSWNGDFTSNHDKVEKTSQIKGFKPEYMLRNLSIYFSF